MDCFLLLALLLHPQKVILQRTVLEALSSLTTTADTHATPSFGISRGMSYKTPWAAGKPMRETTKPLCLGGA